ncbi:MAG: hypothetical protein ACI9CE_002983 [Flavobacterium sp.]|jgi:hypothetical protein
MFRFLMVIPFLVFCATIMAAEKIKEVQTLGEDELQNYDFKVEEDRFIVGDLSAGQLLILNRLRDESKALFVRHLGILSIKGTKEDIPYLQQIIDRRIIRKDETRKWQALGVLFGDVLAKEFNMTWARYEDKYGLSKALRWRRTDNYMFPVVMFSKRVGFDEIIDVKGLYNKIAKDVESFKAWELKPKLPNSLKSS